MARHRKPATPKPPPTQSGFMSDLPKWLTGALNGIDNNAVGGAKGQFLSNIFSAYQNAGLNRPNEVTPYGGVKYTQNPDGTFSRNVTLSDNQNAINQGIEQRDIGLGKAAQGFLSPIDQLSRNPYSLSGIAGLPGEGNLMSERQRLEKELIGRQDQMNNPRWQQERQALIQQMADEGKTQGSPIYQKMLDQLSQRQTAERNQYTTSAIQQGGTEATNLFNRGLEARQQGIGEYESQRYAPINEMGQIQGLQRGVVSPDVTPMAGIDFGNVDVAGLGTQWTALNKSGGGGGGRGGGGGMPNYNSQLISALTGGSGGTGGGQVIGGGGWGNALAGIGQGFGQGLAIGGMNSKIGTTQYPQQQQQQFPLRRMGQISPGGAAGGGGGRGFWRGL